MKQSLDKKWCIAQIKPNSYDCAIQNLERQGFETFLPRMKITQRQKNKFLVKKVYVFLKIVIGFLKKVMVFLKKVGPP